MATMTPNAHIPEEILARLDALGESVQRTRNYLIIEALLEYIANEEEDIRLTRQALDESARGEGIPEEQIHEEMVAWLEGRGVSREEQAVIRARVEAEFRQAESRTA